MKFLYDENDKETLFSQGKEELKVLYFDLNCYPY